MSSQFPLEDLLSAVTDALLLEDQPIEPIIARYDVDREQVKTFVTVIERLHRTLTGVQPSPRFVNKLKADLMGSHQQGVLSRVRYLPPRVQVAAGFVAVVGFILLAHRRITDLAHTDKSEKAAEAEAF
jgi:hypothetical protein